MGLIFDLDQTIIDSSAAYQLRKQGAWQRVYDLIPKFKLYDSIYDVLQYGVNNGLKICIVTASPSVYCKKVVEYWNIPYSNLVCYHDTRFKKPHPEPIIKALTLLGVSPDKSISFGDRAIDIQASHAANVKSVGCYWGSSEGAELKSSRPDFEAHFPRELIPIIKLHFKL